MEDVMLFHIGNFERCSSILSQMQQIDVRTLELNTEDLCTNSKSFETNVFSVILLDSDWLNEQTGNLEYLIAWTGGQGLES
jgi:hypothetical protein